VGECNVHKQSMSSAFGFRNGMSASPAPVLNMLSKSSMSKMLRLSMDLEESAKDRFRDGVGKGYAGSSGMEPCVNSSL
jgi:hypothetical protein